MTVEEILTDYEKYRPFLKGGGLTVTGGEPLMQIDFLLALFKQAKKQDIHTCIDTSGIAYNESNHAYIEKLDALMSFTDLVMLDIKHIDDEKCKNLVGFSNKLELNFARYLSNQNIPIWIRQVLVPGYTDDKFDLQKLKAFINSLSNVEKVELLPYHNLGKFKWDEIGDKYELENVVPPSQEDIKKAEQILGI